MRRRDFIVNTSLTGSGLLAFGGLRSAAAFNYPEGMSMPLSKLGRTGEKVSMIGIGVGHWAHEDVNPDDLGKLFDRAMVAGINYFDAAPNYGEGESVKRLGKVMKGRRDKVFLVSKTESPTYEGTWKLLEQSLDNLQTDYLDLVHLHNLGNEKRFTDLDTLFSKQGAMEALREAKKKGMIRFIGASGHLGPSRFHYVIDSGEIDVLMVAVNYIVQHTYDFEHKIWARAKTKDIGLAAMKVFGGREGKPGNFKIPKEDYDSALRYALSLDGLSTAVLGVTDAGQLEPAINLMKDFKPMTEEEFLQLSQKGLAILQKDPSWREVYGKPLA